MINNKNNIPVCFSLLFITCVNRKVWKVRQEGQVKFKNMSLLELFTARTGNMQVKDFFFLKIPDSALLTFNSVDVLHSNEMLHQGGDNLYAECLSGQCLWT